VAFSESILMYWHYLHYVHVMTCIQNSCETPSNCNVRFWVQG